LDDQCLIAGNKYICQYNFVLIYLDLSTLLLVALRNSEQDRPASVCHGTETELRGTMNRTGIFAAWCLDRQCVSRIAHRLDASNIANCLGGPQGFDSLSCWFCWLSCLLISHTQ